jgi:hypothetical protein
MAIVIVIVHKLVHCAVCCVYVLCICIYIINGTIEYRGSPLGKVCFQRMSTLRLSINPLASLFFDVQRPNPNPGCGFESTNKHFNINSQYIVCNRTIFTIRNAPSYMAT